MNWKSLTLTLSITFVSWSSLAENGGDRSSAVNSFKKASVEYTRQAKEYYSKSKKLSGDERIKYQKAAELTEKLAQIKKGFAKSFANENWTEFNKFKEQYNEVNSNRSKVLWGSQKECKPHDGQQEQCEKEDSAKKDKKWSGSDHKSGKKAGEWKKQKNSGAHNKLVRRSLTD